MAARFIQRYESGWKDALAGPLVPEFMLTFYSGSRGLGGFGIGMDQVMSDRMMGFSQGAYRNPN
jgi:hypothetical protein